MKPLFFVVPGKPSAKKRPRFSRHSVYNSQKSVEDRFRWELKKQLPKGFAMLPRDTALSVECGFFLPIPKSVSKKQRSLMSDEKFDARYNPGHPDRHNSGWAPVLVASFTLLFGTVMLMFGIAMIVIHIWSALGWLDGLNLAG